MVTHLDFPDFVSPRVAARLCGAREVKCLSCRHRFVPVRLLSPASRRAIDLSSLLPRTASAV